ncbi:MAG: hypothetical protein OIN87_10665 [Candidatus Methanoperedens sp.]|nr:hypothetical protein [Candidatus Methanoperedens sp.]
MVLITLRQKIILEIYSILSLFAAIVILFYYTYSGSIGEDIYYPVAVIICLFSGAFIYFLRILIKDVNSIQFYEDIHEDESKVIEIKKINKITLELFSVVSNVILVAAIIIYGISGTSGIYSELLSIIFILMFSIPIIILIRYIVVYLNMRVRRGDEYFIFKIVNKGTIFLLLVSLILVSILSSSNYLVSSLAGIYEKPLLLSDDTMTDLSSKIYINKITGEKKDAPGAPITGLNIYIGTTELNYYINSINIYYSDKNSTSTFEYGILADRTHFSFRDEHSDAKKNILDINEVGIIRINLSSTGQELYSNKIGTLTMNMGSNKNISKEIKTLDLKEGYFIQLYKK